MDEDEQEQTQDDVDIMREQIEHLEGCLTAAEETIAEIEAECSLLKQRLVAAENDVVRIEFASLESEQELSLRLEIANGDVESAECRLATSEEECSAKEAEIQRIYAVQVEQKQWIEDAFHALVDADSELSAFGHGRPLDKATALQVSGLCRSVYERARKVVVNERGGSNEC